jgi:O-antigen/teichoic acid export membrane protein
MEESAEGKRDVNELAMGAGITLAGRVIGRGLRLLADIVLARVLGPAAFGLYVIAWTLTRIATLISPLGMDAAIVRFGSLWWRRDNARLKGVMTQTIYLSALSGALFGVGFYFAAPWLSESIFHNTGLIGVFREFAFAFPLMSCLRVAAAATQVSRRMKFAVYAEELSQPATSLVLILGFTFAGWSLAGDVAAIVLSFGFALLLCLRYLAKLFPEVLSRQTEPECMGKDLILFSAPASLSVVSGMLLLWVDRLYVGHFRSAAEAGIYHAASQLSIALAVILSGFSGIMSPMTATLSREGKTKRLEELYRVSTKWAFYFSLPLFLVMCFAPREIMTVGFGEAYEIGYIILPVLGVGQLINAGTGPSGSLLVMTGHQNKISALTAGMTLLNIILGVLLVPRWGMLGAAVGTAFGLALLCLWSIYLIRRYLGIWPYDRRYLKGISAAVVATAVLFLMREASLPTPVWTLLLKSAVSAIVFGSTLLGLGLDSEDRDFVNLVLARWRSI